MDRSAHDRAKRLYERLQAIYSDAYLPRDNVIFLPKTFQPRVVKEDEQSGAEPEQGIEGLLRKLFEEIEREKK